MGYILKAENHRGEVIDLSTNPNYILYKIEGLQPPTVNVNVSDNATSDGSTFNSARANSRNIVIYVAIKGIVEESRINLYKYFPLKKKIKLYYKNDTRDVYIEGYVELIECDLFSASQVAQISIICPQPYFKGVDELVSYFSDISSLLQFPFSIASSGIEFSAITTNIRKSIINTGDIESGIIIRLYAIGSVVNPIVYDVFNRTYIKLNLTMLADDEIIINTYKGEKSITLVRNGLSSNVIGYMAADSTWLTLQSGDNVFTYDAESGNSNLQLTFTTSVLYGGV